MEGIDLRPALAAVLVAHAAGQAHRLGEDLLQGIVASDPAADISDHSAEIGPKLAQSLVGALELMGMGVALVLDQGDLADARIALAKDDAVALGQSHHDLARPVDELGVGRKHHRLGLHRGVDDHPGEVLRSHRRGAGGNRQALLQQSNEFLLTHTLAPARQ